MRKLKNYFTLFNTTYMVVADILIPVGFAVASLLLSFIFESTPSFLICFFIYMVVDGMTDYFAFGNIYQKNNMGMDYLKTSFEGMVVMKDALHVDYFTRFIRPAIFMLLAWGLNSINLKDDTLLNQLLVPWIGMKNIVLIVLEMYLAFVFMQILLVNIDRYISMAQTVYTLNSFVTLGADALIGFIVYQGAMHGTPVLIAIIVTTVALLIVEAVISIIHIDKKLQMSFYDEVEKED
ncbi:MAG: hypothetical protein J6O60_02260 [Lachnospiraceae bacterium]|nr:hypothetical protein [Lachnospiraceae bacterium]